MKNKIAIIGTVGIPANYGGFETLAEHLVSNLSKDYSLSVYCSGKRYAKSNRKKRYKQSRLIFLPFDANGISSIMYDALSILHSLFYADVLLVLGVSGAFMFPFVRLFTNKKIIVSIDGIEWKRDKWSLLAKLYLFWAEKIAVKYSHIDISDNEAIQNYTAKRYGSLSRVIEYGADHTLKVKPSLGDIKTYPFIKGTYAFNVSRIEPENNIHIILEAFKELRSYTLVIVGNWENSTYGKMLKEKYETYKNMYLLDPIYNQRILDTLRGNAFLYIHGHSAGGTNPSLVEAMFLKLPIISYDVSYNRTTTENKAIYFKSTQQLIQILKQINVQKLSILAKNMKQTANQRYTWKLICEKYQKLIAEAFQINKKTEVKSSASKLSKEVLTDLNLHHIKYENNFYN